MILIAHIFAISSPLPEGSYFVEYCNLLSFSSELVTKIYILFLFIIHFY
jgi:hypothetical protein